MERLALTAALVVAAACAAHERPAGVPDAAPVTPGLDAAGAESDAPVSSDTVPPDAGLSQAAFAASYCRALSTCCTDEARCRAALEGMSPYREAMAEPCLALLRAGAARLCTDGYTAAAPTCRRVFATVVASKRLGEPCRQDDDCLLSPQGPVRCAGEAEMGRCQVQVRGKEGQTPCVGTRSGPVTFPPGGPMSNAIQGFLCDVADGLWCDDTTGKCTRSKDGACTSFGECGAGRYCDDGTGRCTDRKGLGADCTVDEECEFTICGEDNECAPPPAVDPALARCVTP